MRAVRGRAPSLFPTHQAPTSSALASHLHPAPAFDRPATPPVHEVLRSPGQPLDAAARAEMESRFGHDFGQVRVHSGARAGESARAVDALAYTVGPDVVFASGRYRPDTSAGRALLAHELAHVVQQEGAASRPPGSVPRPVDRGRADRAEVEARRAVGDAAAGRPVALAAGSLGPALQRQTPGEDEGFRWPRSQRQPAYQLHLDPQIEAEIQAAQQARLLLAPETVRLSLSDLDLDAILGTPPPPWLTTPSPPPPAPLVPAGAGPSEPRQATPGDLLRAVMRVPAIDSALTTLQTRAGDQVTRDWRSLSTGGRVALISQTALIGGGALAGVLSDPGARTFTLGLIQNRDIPVPGVPGLTFQFNLTGADQRVKFDLNVGALLPRSWGFH
jgi:Domain of unknown function (DUF4157)